MSKLVWDKTSERLYETGTDRGVLFVQNSDGTYEDGVAWNGLTSVTESPSGAEANDQYADNIKYLTLRSAEEFGGTIEAFMYPDEWGICDGSAEPVEGIVLGQQSRRPFGLSYRTVLGNDTQYNDHGYKIHLVYNATASPSEKQYQTINDSPEAISFSWEFSCTKVDVPGYKPVASLTIDSTRVNKDILKKFEDILYGTDATSGDTTTTGTAPKLLSPEEVIAMFTKTESSSSSTTSDTSGSTTSSSKSSGTGI